MGSVLLVSSANKANEQLEILLKSNSYNSVTIAKNSSEARRLVMHADFDIVVINSPLIDEVGTDLAISLSQSTASGILMIVKLEQVTDTIAKVEDDGVIVVSKPINRTSFYQSVKLVTAMKNRLLRLENENKKLKRKIEEIRLTDRAKCLLIEHKHLTEAEAHRYIEKLAMDTRRSKKQIATDIIEDYED